MNSDNLHNQLKEVDEKICMLEKVRSKLKLEIHQIANETNLNDILLGNCNEYIYEELKFKPEFFPFITDCDFSLKRLHEEDFAKSIVEIYSIDRDKNCEFSYHEIGFVFSSPENNYTCFEATQVRLGKAFIDNKIIYYCKVNENLEEAKENFVKKILAL